MSNYPNPDFPLNVTETEDGFELEWDENHPVTSIFNDWTEQDFTDAIISACKRILGEEMPEEELREEDAE